MSFKNEVISGAKAGGSVVAMLAVVAAISELLSGHHRVYSPRVSTGGYYLGLILGGAVSGAIAGPLASRVHSKTAAAIVGVLASPPLVAVATWMTMPAPWDWPLALWSAGIFTFVMAPIMGICLWRAIRPRSSI